MLGKMREPSRRKGPNIRPCLRIANVFEARIDASDVHEMPFSDALYFGGFYCWNSEVGSKTLGMASFFLRAVCMNRNIWGAEGFEEISIRHSKFAANRFAHEVAPAPENFAQFLTRAVHGRHQGVA